MYQSNLEWYEDCLRAVKKSSWRDVTQPPVTNPGATGVVARWWSQWLYRSSSVILSVALSRDYHKSWSRWKSDTKQARGCRAMLPRWRSCTYAPPDNYCHSSLTSKGNRIAGDTLDHQGLMGFDRSRHVRTSKTKIVNPLSKYGP